MLTIEKGKKHLIFQMQKRQKCKYWSSGVAEVFDEKFFGWFSKIQYDFLCIWQPFRVVEYRFFPDFFQFNMANKIYYIVLPKITLISVAGTCRSC